MHPHTWLRACSSSFHCIATALLALVVASCSGRPGPSADATDGSDALRTDAALPGDSLDAPAACLTDTDCSDGVFCNGTERCAPGSATADARGCAPASPATPCQATQACQEANQRCVTACPTAPDADGDGHRAIACGGDDCDDSDGLRYPGNTEVCDATNHDEDCDPTTFGFRDADMDSYADAWCCNVDMAATRHCGDDCNDSRPNAHPALAEVCDGLDNNCDGNTDEGVLVTYYPDGDGDGFGTSTGSSDGGTGDAGAVVQACLAPAGYASTVTDCNDHDSSVHPGAVEQCDALMVDENCDGLANPAALCSCNGDVSVACRLPGACAAGMQRCVGGSLGACSILPTVEVCNGVDDNCDGATDEMLSVTCYPDGDNDGYAAAGATAVRSCPVPGRDAFAGCPPNQTNRAPFGGNIDCNDADSTISPGLPELCDVAMRDENCDGIANPPSQCSCTDGQTRQCSSLGSCGAGSQTCSLGQWGACSIYPVAEVCNGIDDNCNGVTDEGTTITCYVDGDNDGYAAAGALSAARCSDPTRTGVGGCPVATTNRAPGLGTTDCNDTNAGVSPAVSEVCNGIDDNCDGVTDEGTTITCYADGDGDGYASLSAPATQRCTDPTRPAVGSCPVGYTNRVPTAGMLTTIDCNDTAAAVSPAAVELCDALTVDENCDGVANPASLCACSGTVSRTCAQGGLSGVCAAGTETCATGAWGPCTIQPTTEICNGLDDNCNGTTDEMLTVTCYADADNDTYPPSGAAASQRCSDSSRPAAGGCPTGSTYRAPGAGTADCNDANPSVNPGITEVCNGVDDNCNGMTDEGTKATCYGDVDGDTYAPGGAASTPLCMDPARSATVGGCPVGYTNRAPVSGMLTAIDCTDNNAAVSPAASEVCNGLDDNCNGTTDEGLRVTCYADGDNDGYALASAPSTAMCPVAGRDAVGGCPTGFTNRAPGAGTTDCLDTNAGVSPAATEVCNGVDDNCNGMTDEGLTVSCYADVDNDTYSPGGGATTQCPNSSRTAWGGCPSGLTNRVPSGLTSADCNDASGTINPAAIEVCNGVDDDCDGVIDDGVTVLCYRDADDDAYAAAGSTTASTYCPVAGRGQVGGCPYQTTNRAPGGTNTDCNDLIAAINPVALDICNGVDDNCDNVTDNAATADVACTVPNSTSGCRSGACVLLACNAGYGDCDGIRSTGCEVPLSSNTNCGGCFVACGPRGQCASGHCDRVVQVASGTDFECALRSSGGVNCWGRSSTGALGNGDATFANQLLPVAVVGITNATSLSAGDGHACARLATGAIMCWGDNTSGQLGNNSTTSSATPVQVSGITTASDVSCGTAHTCALLANGTVVCWGSDGGQLGDGTSSTTNQLVPGTIAVGISNAVEVRAGGFHTCVRLATGAVSCFGANSSGQVGNGNTTSPQASPVAVTAITTATQLALSASTSCARLATGELRCWGSNIYGQVGNTTTTSPVLTPTSVSSFGGASASAQAVDVGSSAASHTVCATAADQSSRCWGYNSIGQVGSGSATPSSVATPATVAGLYDGAALRPGYDQNCAVRYAGDVFCWGSDFGGQLGDGTLVDHLAPATVQSLTNSTITQYDAGADATCARRANGLVQCWGDVNLVGDGTPNTGANRAHPGKPLSGIDDAVEVSLGWSAHGCVRRSTGAIWCWGDNTWGQFGVAAPTTSAVPVAGPSYVDSANLAVGTNSTCVQRQNGSVWCWGRNDAGQLGNGTTTNSATPVQVAGLSDARRVDGTYKTMCVQRATGQAACWGDNTYGEIGNGSVVSPVTTPYTISWPDDFIEARASDQSTCARRIGGNVWCWGDNVYGELGDGTTISRATPGLSRLLDASYLGQSVNLAFCSVRASGSVASWGLGGSGQIGDGTTVNRLSPTTLSLQAASADSGRAHSCALAVDGTLRCWGDNTRGATGTGLATGGTLLSPALVLGTP